MQAVCYTPAMSQQDAADAIGAISIFSIVVGGFNVIGHAYDMPAILPILISGGSGHVLFTTMRRRWRSRRGRS